MATYAVVWEDKARRADHQDAYCVGLGVERDGERLGKWVPMVSGIALKTTSQETSPAFWGALAVIGAERVREQMVEGSPDGWQIDAWPLLIEAAQVFERANGDPAVPTETSDEAILRFEVP